MYTKGGTSNYLKKCLSFILIFGSLVVLLIIFYLENDSREESAEDDILFFNEATIQDERKLLNLSDFHYVIKNNVCGEPFRKNILAILIVTSYAGDFETRSAIRRAFPSKVLAKFGVRRVFLLALIDENKNYNRVSQSAIQDENNRFHDIVQGNFYEAYRNLTYKHIMGLRFASSYCPQAKYVIKMDHDIIFDFYRLNFLLRKLPRVKYLLAGYILSHMKPIREPKNKWFVTKEEYPRDSYPNFLSGWFYITTPKVAQLLSKLSNNVKYFWIDDLYVTGLLIEKTNISLTKINRFYTTHHEYLQCCIDKPSYTCDYLIGPTSSDNKLFFKFQKYAENCFYKNCKKRREENSVKSTCIATWKEEPFGKGHAIVDLVKL
ncbi:hypothetical protein RUM43_001173 [Polyplax serrata]|uniref:Hexosyltransferase n=1 Tax=Polyplax serrata TaxID=468196 RepID=A0AAN8SDZ6_POLSC